MRETQRHLLPPPSGVAALEAVLDAACRGGVFNKTLQPYHPHVCRQETRAEVLRMLHILVRTPPPPRLANLPQRQPDNHGHGRCPASPITGPGRHQPSGEDVAASTVCALSLRGEKKGATAHASRAGPRLDRSLRTVTAPACPLAAPLRDCCARREPRRTYCSPHTSEGGRRVADPIETCKKKRRKRQPHFATWLPGPNARGTGPLPPPSSPHRPPTIPSSHRPLPLCFSHPSRPRCAAAHERDDGELSRPRHVHVNG